MAALVVTVSPANGLEQEGRIGIFPGGATTTMYPADTPFWVGYGFAADVVGEPTSRTPPRGSSSTWTASPSRCSPTCTRLRSSRAEDEHRGVSRRAFPSAGTTSPGAGTTAGA